MEKKSLIYIANLKMPTEKAHGVHIMKMCEAFADNGVEVELIAAQRKTSLKGDPHEYFGVKKNFKITRVWSWDIIRTFPYVGFWLQTFTFIFAAVKYLWPKRKSARMHTRDMWVMAIFRRLGFNITYEAHRIPGAKQRSKGTFFFLVRKAKAVITNSKGVAAEFTEHGFPRVKAIPNGVNPRDYDIKDPKHDLRQQLSLPNAFLVMYTGHLYDWKGVDTMVEAAELSKGDSAVHYVFVGGTKEDRLKYKKTCEDKGLRNVTFVPFVPNALVPRYLAAADVLVLPNKPVTEESQKYTSPMKLFEYMASKKPIIASDMPAMREVVNESNGVLIPPGDAKALVDSVTKLRNDGELRSRLSEAAFKDVTPYTWPRRAEQVYQFITGNGE